MSFAIGIINTKTPENLGTLWRSAYNFGASMVFTIGKRYKKQCTDTFNTFKQIPLIHYEDYKDFVEHMPYSWEPIVVEIDDSAQSIVEFNHPREAVYILGGEDCGVPREVLQRVKRKIFIPTNRCLNVAVTGSIVMYDRAAKKEKKNQQPKRVKGEQ